MECFFGDAILFKVEKDFVEEDEKIAHFKVISMCNEVDVVNKFIDEYLFIDENFELVFLLFLQASSPFCYTSFGLLGFLLKIIFIYI
jgi:hypothetical protein